MTLVVLFLRNDSRGKRVPSVTSQDNINEKNDFGLLDKFLDNSVSSSFIDWSEM
jgi:hypothetical protein